MTERKAEETTDERHETDESDDVTFDSDETQSDTLKRLKRELARCREERQEYLDGWQRAQADLVNLRKVGAEGITVATRRGGIRVAEHILPAMDSFASAFADTERWQSIESSWRTGVEQIHQQLLRGLAAADIHPMQVEVNEPFDPNRHEPVEVVPAVTPEQDNTVMFVVQAGWMHGDDVLRPAKVRVAQYQEHA